MRDFLMIIQCASIIMLMFETGYIFLKWKTRIQGYLFVICLSTLLNSFGYILAIQSTTLNEYLLGLKMSYFGRVWVPFSLLLFVNALCKRKNSSILLIPLSLIHLAVLCLVATSEHHSLYFQNMSLNTAGIFPCLAFEKGALYLLYNNLIILYMIYGVSLLIYTILHEKNPIQKKRISLVLAAIAAESAFYLLEIYGNTIGFDDTVIGYGISTFIMFIAIFKYSLLDTLKIVRDYIVDEVSEVIVVVNDKDEIEYFNQPALTIFPELTTNASAVLSNLRDSIFSQTPITLDDKIYTSKANELIEDGISIGTIFVLTDDTEHYAALTIYENYNEDLTNQVNEKTKRIRDIQSKTILGMAQVIESRDLNTGGHVKRTSDVVRIFSERILSSNVGISKDFLDLVIRSAPMHDLGKIGVDDAILRKQGKFTNEEYDKMKMHSEIGAKLIDEILTGVEDEEFVRVALNVAHYHHEKVNGNGYPKGLKGNEIPMEARIMALADVFDALVSKRCYKDAFSYDKAFDIIREDAGEHFDRVLANIFIACRPELEAYYNTEQSQARQS